MKLVFLYAYCKRVMLLVTELLPDWGVLSLVKITLDYPPSVVGNPAYAKVLFEKLSHLRLYFLFSGKVAESL